MSIFSSRGAQRRLASLILSAALIAGAGQRASAEDGVTNFFSSIFGGGQNTPVSAPSQPAEDAMPRVSRPLTVKLHRPKVASLVRMPTKPGEVSIFEDTTLRRGDAVMTRQGMRIFAGSSKWPYQDADFVAVSDAGRMDKGIQKTLISMDKLPRN